MRSSSRSVAARAVLAVILAACGSGCYGGDTSDRGNGGSDVGLRINELMASNDGVWIDEQGATDDWIELINVADEPIALGRVRISDAESIPMPLPDRMLAPGEVLLLWADGNPEEGELHLDFKLSAAADRVTLWDAYGTILDEVAFEALASNESLARLPDGEGDPSVCRYATPARANGTNCEAAAPPSLPDDTQFEDFDWPVPWPAVKGPLVLAELALRPAGFVEILNTSGQEVALGGHVLVLSVHEPGLAWPAASDGVVLPLGSGTLAAGERLVVELAPDDTAALEATASFEGVATLFDADAEVVDRVDFMRWPQDAALTRVPDADGHHRFCAAFTPGEPNSSCEPLAAREVGDRLRHFYTPGDFAALAAGGTSRGVDSVKFVIDMATEDTVHLLGSKWPLHYTFVREQIDREPVLDRCDADDNALFYEGWVAFSETEYRQVAGRRYLSGELSVHGGSGLHTVDFTTGDEITSELMKRAFFGVAAHLDEPAAWAMHPQGEAQTLRMLEIDGQAPIVSENAPFRDVTYQPLTPGVAFGTLRFVPTHELETATLGPTVIVVTDDVPNDIPLVGGLVTEAFQTPLAHVNVLSQARNTPNMGLRNARQAFEPLFDQLVRLEVSPSRYDVRVAEPAEAEAFWESRAPDTTVIAPRLDTSVRGLVLLDEPSRGLADLPGVGAKAAQIAELHRVRVNCASLLPLPPHPAAIAVVHSVEHFDASGGRDLLATLRADPEFRTDPGERARGLAALRELVMQHPVDPQVLAAVEAHLAKHFGTARVRFRSSSNTEDLPGFNGAGLYTSVSGALGDPKRSIDDAIRTVWASLWNARAYDERELAHIDQDEVAMGVLIHPAFRNERANGVAISRNILDPIRGDMHYMNLQAGEASVTNPAPGVVTEQLVFVRHPFEGAPQVHTQSRSSLVPGEVATLAELQRISCLLGSIHDHFERVLDPEGENRWFAMEIELKLLGDARTLLVKQARPHSFGRTEIPNDCREF